MCDHIHLNEPVGKRLENLFMILLGHRPGLFVFIVLYNYLTCLYFYILNKC